jgi:hypothetical protein
MKKFEDFEKIDEASSNNKLATAEKLLERVVHIWNGEYGKGKKYDENSVGGRLIEEIKIYLGD